jgi:ferric-dicitrate binding protein FerR (iron transport regulator)
VTRTCFKLAALFVLLIIAMPIWAQGDLKGRMTSVKGTVNLVRDQAAPVLLHKNDPVLAGDEILTDLKSSATVRMPDGSTLRIYPNSRVVLLTETGNWKDFLHVFLGSVRVQIEKLSGRPNPKTLTTPTAVISVRGTIFSVAVDQAGDTQVGVEKGRVSVANQLNPGDEVMVCSGQSVWVRRDQRPTQPQRMEQPMPGMTGSGDMNMPGSTGGMGTGSAGGMGRR